MAREVISSGNALVAKAAVECGCKFFGGYPITPSSEVAEDLSILLPKNGGKFIQMEDEIGGICVALGASMSGTKAMQTRAMPFTPKKMTRAVSTAASAFVRRYKPMAVVRA